MKDIFKDLRPFQKAELLIMMLLAFAIPFHWLAAQYCEVALLVCAVLKFIFDQKFKLNERQLKFKWAYIIFALTWLVYFIGMIYTDNTSFGWVQVSKKLGFLIFPVIFIISDMSYLTKNRLKALGNALVLGCILFFAMNLVHAVYDVIYNGATSIRFFDADLMKLYYVHHSYLSMYAELGLMFCFNEIFGKTSRKTKVFNGIAYIILVILVILVRSRAGLLFLVLLFIFQWVWLTFVMKKKKTGVIVGCAFVIAIAGACVLFPQSVSRITETVTNIVTEHSSDHRLVQFKGYKSVLENNWLIGVGTGDRCDETMKSYLAYKAGVVAVIGEDMAAELDKKTKDEYYEPSESMRQEMREKARHYGVDPDIIDAYMVEYLYINYAIDKDINAHNMFFETVISVGIIGLLLLMAYFVIPFVLWIKMKKTDLIYLLFLLMIGFNALFESIFESQMGIIFFCFFNCLFFMDNFISSLKSNE